MQDDIIINWWALVWVIILVIGRAGNYGFGRGGRYGLFDSDCGCDCFIKGLRVRLRILCHRDIYLLRQHQSVPLPLHTVLVILPSIVIQKVMAQIFSSSSSLALWSLPSHCPCLYPRVVCGFVETLFHLWHV